VTGPPEFFPRGGFDPWGDNVHKPFFVALLLPEANDEDERLVDGKLPERVAEVHGCPVFDGLRIHGHATVVLVRRGGNVPFLGVTWWPVAVEKCVAHPLLKDEAVRLHFLGRQRADRQQHREEDEARKERHATRLGRTGDSP
jgi:hypothetical protein